MKRDAKRDAPWPTETLSYGERSELVPERLKLAPEKPEPATENAEPDSEKADPDSERLELAPVWPKLASRGLSQPQKA